MRAKGHYLPLSKILRALKFREGGSRLSPVGVIVIVSNYAYYRDTYLGSLLTEENFAKYALRADSYLDLLTTGRYEKDCLPEKAVEAVKMAECAIAELCLNLEQAELQSDAAWKVQSEKVGSHSVQFRNNAEIAEQTERQIRNTASRYLARWGLLYRGCG